MSSAIRCWRASRLATSPPRCPARRPEDGEPFESIMADFERVLVPGLTHWNHPGFFAYFAITGSRAGRAGRVSLAPRSISRRCSGGRRRRRPSSKRSRSRWLRKLLGLPDSVRGRHLRHGVDQHDARARWPRVKSPCATSACAASPAAQDLPTIRVYCSEQAHSSIDKAVIAIGLGHDSLRKIPVDDDYRMRADGARATPSPRTAPRAALPIAVVATVGTTSTTSIDPVPAIADICARERLWLHVDAAYAGVAAMLPSHAHVLGGAGRADSLVVNPHKWLFTPVRSQRVLLPAHGRRFERRSRLTPEFILSGDEAAAARRNLMDTGIQLGRRFRSLKLWMILRSFGAKAIRAHLAEHIRLAQLFASWVDAHRFRTPRARPVQRRLLPLEPARHDGWSETHRQRSGRGERTSARYGQRERRSVSVAYPRARGNRAAPCGRSSADRRAAHQARVGSARGSRRHSSLNVSPSSSLRNTTTPCWGKDAWRPAPSGPAVNNSASSRGRCG